MKISVRHFPHPVLSHFDDALPERRFSFDLDVVPNRAKDAYVFSVKFIVDSAELQNLIERKQAYYSLHVEAPSNRFRDCWTTYSEKMKFEIDAHDLDEEVQVNAFILASTDLRGYNNPDFHPDYAGHSFPVRRGEFLAIAEPKQFDVEKEMDPQENQQSIFVLSLNSQKNAPAITFDAGGSRIVIRLSPENYDRYRVLQDAGAYNAVLNSMVVVQVLSSILQMLSKWDDGNGQGNGQSVESQHDTYNDCRWYKVLTRRLTAMGIKDWNIENPLETAQQLVDQPITKALIALEQQEINMGQSLGSDEQ